MQHEMVIVDGIATPHLNFPSVQVAHRTTASDRGILSIGLKIRTDRFGVVFMIGHQFIHLLQCADRRGFFGQEIIPHVSGAVLRDRGFSFSHSRAQAMIGMKHQTLLGSSHSVEALRKSWRYFPHFSRVTFGQEVVVP